MNSFLFCNRNQNGVKELLQVVSDVHVSIETHPLKKLAARVLPQLGKPLPFSTQTQLKAKLLVDR